MKIREKRPLAMNLTEHQRRIEATQFAIQRSRVVQARAGELLEQSRLLTQHLHSIRWLFDQSPPGPAQLVQL